MLILKLKSISLIIFLLFLLVICVELLSDETHSPLEDNLFSIVIVLLYLIISIYQEVMFLWMVVSKAGNVITGLSSVIMTIISNILSVLCFAVLFYDFKANFQKLNPVKKFFCIGVFALSCFPLFKLFLLKTLQIFNRIRFSQTPLGRRKLKIMSWNIQRGLNFYWQYDLDRSLQYIKNVDPDILCLQEADLGEDFYKIKLLARDMKADLVQTPQKHENIIILSKYPVEYTDVLELDKEGDAGRRDSEDDSKSIVCNLEDDRFLLSALVNLDVFSNIKIWISKELLLCFLLNIIEKLQ